MTEAELRIAQKALATGDLKVITDLIIDVAARSKAQRIRVNTPPPQRLGEV